MIRIVRFAVAAAFFALAAPSAVFAATLQENLNDLVENHKRIKAALHDVEAAREQIPIATGGWYPDLDITAHYGYEKQIKGQGTKNTHLPSRELDLTLTQLLWDFDSTNQAINIAELGLKQSLAILVATR
ncbi:MAG: TolC family protein, partial [Rhodospirillales bacterium]